MAKKSTTEVSDPELITSVPKKNKSLFDHISHIREIKSSGYFKTLNDAEKANFNKYVILLGLSMDPDAIENIAYVSKYMDILSQESLYRVCCDLTPKGRKFSKWIKSSKPRFTLPLLDVVAKYFKINRHESYDYCTTFLMDEAGIQELINICSNSGLTEKETEKLLEGTNE